MGFPRPWGLLPLTLFLLHALGCQAGGPDLKGGASNDQTITPDDLRAYYAANLFPAVDHVSVAGDDTREEAIEHPRDRERKGA